MSWSEDVIYYVSRNFTEETLCQFLHDVALSEILYNPNLGCKGELQEEDRNLKQKYLIIFLNKENQSVSERAKSLDCSFL